jgi:acyl-coenzyme A synthetase/AMP-(fatty) acid ligase/acyl carrier protein
MGGASPSRVLAASLGPPLAIIPGSPYTVSANLAARVAERPDGSIRSYGPAGVERYASYAETWHRAGRILTGMRAYGIRLGQVVVLLIEDVVDFVPAYWACIRGGFVVAPLMSAARERSGRDAGDCLRQALKRLNNATIVADEAFAAIAGSEAREQGLATLPLHIAEANDGHNHEDAFHADPLCLVPSSGSTGSLKLVALSHNSVLYRHFAEPFQDQASYLGTVALDSVSAAQHGVFLRYASWTQMSPLALTIEPTSVLDAIERHHITVAGCTPSTIRTIMAAAQGRGRRWNLGSLNEFGVGAETVSVRAMHAFGDFLEGSGASREIVKARYGTTETGFLVSGANPFEGHDNDDVVHLGTCAPGVGLRIVGDADQVLADGEIGEVQVNSPQKIFARYWGEAGATQRSFTADGWWRTGDLGRLRNGRVSLHGRTKDVIVVSGRKFSLTEIDAEIEVLLSVGDRAFSCAVHWPGDATERLAVVFVAAVDRPERRAELADNIRIAVGRRFGLLPQPIIAASMDDIPLANNGKLRRGELATRIRAGVVGAWEQSASAKPTTAVAISPIADVNSLLQQLWQQALDINDDFDPDADFFDLGGDSLRSMVLYTAIEEKLGKQISAEAFFQCPTFSGLCRLVANTDSVPAATAWPEVPWPLPARLRNKLLVHLEAWDGARPTRDRLIIAANTSGTKTPLVWLFQNAVQFRQLANALGEDQPLYALRSGANVIQYTEDEIQALALRYVAEINEVLFGRPVFVGGACQGAIIARAIAEHLLRRKWHVPLLILNECEGDHLPYAGPVLLIYGRDSDFGNPYLRYRRPELCWRRNFPEYLVAEMRGDHSNTFDTGYVEQLAAIISLHMQKAERSPARLIAKIAKHVLIHADHIPHHMSGGRRHRLAVTVKNTSRVGWPAGAGLMIGNRWMNQAGEIVHCSQERTALPQLDSGGEARFRMAITAPNVTSVMQLLLDVVEEGSGWFHSPEEAPFKVSIHVVADKKLGVSGLPFARRW